jgi:putative transcriptional regulator
MPSMKSLSGHFLVASPQLGDPNFFRTIVLLIQHTDEGALGVVLNRPTSKRVAELWQEVGEAPCDSDGPVYLGGPVPGPIMSLHTNQFFAELEVVPGIFFAAKKKHLDNLVLHKDDPLRIFLGHAGWGPGQLENELKEGAWQTMPAKAEYIFHPDADLWETVRRELTGSALQSMLKIKHVPNDPSVN